MEKYSFLDEVGAEEVGYWWWLVNCDEVADCDIEQFVTCTNTSTHDKFKVIVEYWDNKTTHYKYKSRVK